MPTANRTGSISLRTLPQPMRKESNVSKGCLASTDRSPAFLAERFRDRSRTSHFAKNPSGSKRPKAKRAAGDIRNTPSSSSRSEEHTSELQSLMRISYAVFFLKKKNNKY